MESEVDSLIFTLETADHSQKQPIPLALFGSPWVVTPALVERYHGMTGADPDAVKVSTLHTGQGPRHWECSTVCRAPDTGAPQVFSIKTMDLSRMESRQLKLRARQAGLSVPTAALRFRMGTVLDGAFTSGQSYLVECGDRVLELRYRGEVGRNFSPSLMDSVRACQSISVFAESLWSVIFRCGSVASARVWCSPQQALRLYNDRGIPAGKDRRAALRTWVSEHWRELPSDDAQEFHVVRHMRGAQSFKWRGYDCTLVPSADALSATGLLKAEKVATGPRRRRSQKRTRRRAAG